MERSYRKLSYTAHEPTPQTSKYFHSGIGGIGNYRKLPSPNLLSSPPTTLPASGRQPIPTTSSSFRPFYGGRGGAGNSRSASERAIFSFDEELARDRRAPVYSVGRGGVGNIVNEDSDNEAENEDEDHVSLEGSIRDRRMSTRTVSSTGSGRSDSISGADRLMNRIKKLGKH